jgi:hypothetical protein
MGYRWTPVGVAQDLSLVTKGGGDSFAIPTPPVSAHA